MNETGKVMRGTNNGPPEPLPEHRQKIVEAGMAAHQKVVAEKDELEAKLRDAHLKIEGMTVQLDSLNGIVSMMQSTYETTKIQAEERVAQYQKERDHAIAQTARLDAVLASVFVVIQNAMNEAHDVENN